MKSQCAILDQLSERHADETHVAHELIGRLLERYIESVFSAVACRSRKMAGKRALSCACRAGYKNCARPEKASAAQGGIQLRNPARYFLVGCPMAHAEGSYRQH